MKGIYDIAEAIEAGRKNYENMIDVEMSEDERDFVLEEIYGEQQDERWGRIAHGDNMDYMKLLLERGMERKFQLIYVDPPFFSRSKYQAAFYLDSPILGKSGLIKTDVYDDNWNRDICSYLEMITSRLYMMRELLADTGCIVVHLDWHAAHYVKIVMDEIFGSNNFVNEIIWTYKSGGAGRKSFSKKHDTLLVYSKTGKYKFNSLTEKSYNRDLKPYRFKGVEEFEDEKGWYTLVNMKDVWSIDMVGRTSAERTGYATQKPEKLMERIVRAFSDEGDLCGDFFAGSGSFGASCGKLNRNWILCDIGNIAVSEQICRMVNINSSFAVERQKGAGSICGKVELSIGQDEIRLDKYLPEDEFFFQGSDQALKYVKEDSLSLIKFWSIDRNFDGKIHRSDKIAVNGERSLSIFDTERSGTIGIKGCDVFGNFFDIAEKREERKDVHKE